MRQPKKFNPHPFEYHQELTLEIDSLSNLGVGIARVPIDNPDAASAESQGWVVFVPSTLPGETLENVEDVSISTFLMKNS